MNKVYRGVRTGNGNPVITVREWPFDDEGRVLNPRLDIVNHSPGGLEWGYGGSGPHQLCIALLAEEYPEFIQQHYNSMGDYHDDPVSQWLGEVAFGLLNRIVHRLPRTENWILTSHDIALAMVQIIKGINCGVHHNDGNEGKGNA